jgi:putative ABC transport system substrate-binding protein
MLANPLSLGQKGRTIRRVGVVTASSERLAAPFLVALKQGMSELGWQEGKDVEYRFVHANGAAEQYGALVAELIAQQVDVILVTSTAAATAARQATRSVPIVVSSASGVVDAGIVESLARPGGNVTGLSTQFEDVLPKVIEFLHAIVPGAGRIAILLNERAISARQLWSVAQASCAGLGLNAIRVTASTAAEFAGVADQIARRRCQAVVVTADAIYIAERIRLQEAMQSTLLPVAYGWREHVVLGGLFSYGISLPATFHQAATFVDRILKGAKPADLPVEQPTKFELVVNLKTARELGLTIPQTILLRADEVIR